ncbi:MAG: hypothetical protein PHH58_15390 [Rhodoferax sp.]|nr:hypothetical protein [Rhodoferax sp.]
MKTVMHISSTGVQYWRRQAHTWQACDSLASGSLWVVCNLPEESFAEIEIPRIFGRDRQNFIHRQLSSRFPDTPYRTVLTQPGSGSFMDRLAPPRQTIFGVDSAQRINEALAAHPSCPVAGVWATSMLMAQLSAHKSLPNELFVVLPADDGLRIVFIKNQLPVLSRLVPGADHAAEQAAEIARTVRHLENSRVLARSSEPRNVLLLDQRPDIEPWLAQERLTRVLAPPAWRKKPPLDWRFALFDLAVASPAGQLAPLSRRTRFVANRLRPLVYGAAGLCVGIGIWASVGSLNDIASGLAQRKLVQQRVDLLTQQSTDVEQKIAAFGVSAQTVRNAVVLEQDEISSVPPVATHLHQLSDIVSAFDPVRLHQLDWKILAVGQPACVNSATPAPAVNPAQPTEAALPKRVIEISFKINWPDRQGERIRNQGIADLSTQLAKIQGIQLLADPAQGLKLNPLSGGDTAAKKSAEEFLTWCFTVPGTTAAATTVRQP